ncbi:MAG: hypothetical protein K9W43_02785 [Candidatus Thorarchaeota archaeon]|nr:hypothetical protein [Candidatus Thorarchaeota archaeon]
MEREPSSDELHLPFPHGVEIELQILKRDGSWIRGEEVLELFEKIVSSAKDNLERRIRSSDIASVRRKYKYSTRTEEGERGSRIVASYEDPSGVAHEYTLLGHDPNVTSLTWILEVATPPCTTAEELAWWIQTLIAISYESIPKDSKTILISTGLNPTQEYLKNLSFGEHHHILGPDVDEATKLGVYNMIRNFIPHLIALSVNSPFENKMPTSEVSVDEHGRLRAPRCKRSIRLSKNTTQLGPTSEFEFIPYLRSADEEYFARQVNRSYARMVDLYPFTDYKTIELRIFDTQLSVPRRVGIALLLQALALKAKKMVSKGENIPDMGAKALAANRESAVSAGLWAPFRPGVGSENPTFTQAYNYRVRDDGTIDTKKKNRFMSDAVVSMLYLIREELEDLGLIENPFMQALFVSIFGSEFVKPRTTGAEFQLEVYAKSDLNMVVLLRNLAEITRSCCTNWLYDPLEGTPNLPTWLCWWKGLEPEIIPSSDYTIAGDDASFTILLRNTTRQDMMNLTLTYTIESSDRAIIEHNITPITKVAAGEVREERITFQTSKGVSAYNIIVQIGIAGREINLTSTLNTYWTRATIHSEATTQFADGKTPVLFTSEIETNYPSPQSFTCQIAVIAPRKEAILAETSTQVSIDRSEPLILSHTDLTPLVISADASDRVERCVLRLVLVDPEGREHTRTVSKPFYVGFMARRPVLRLRTDAKKSHHPGDVIHGEVALDIRGGMKIQNPRLVVSFKGDTGDSTKIGEFDEHDLLSHSVRFRWRVPALLSVGSRGLVGRIHVALIEDDEVRAEIESEPFEVYETGVTVVIGSMRLPESLDIGAKLKGWLRIRRNTEEGKDATLRLRIEYPEGGAYTLLVQRVKPLRNITVEIGPLEIPFPSGRDAPTSGLITAELIYDGAVVDSKTHTITFAESKRRLPVAISITGVPPFVMPDDFIEGAVEIANESEVPLQANVTIQFESVVGNEVILSRGLSLERGRSRLLPAQFRIPLTSEMSTAFLSVSIDSPTGRIVERKKIKIKAIAQPLFSVIVSIRDELGREIPGLVPRASRLEILADVQSYRAGIENITLHLQIMKKKQIIEKFEIPIDFSTAPHQVVRAQWTTPAVEMVTGFYLETALSHNGRPIPPRAIESSRRQITVY